MADPIQVEVTRGGIVEALHTVHAVAVQDGQIVAEAGDPRWVTLLRSAAKPLQVLPLVRARPDLADREIAIACASHGHRPEQLDAVRALLARRPRPRPTSKRAGPTPLEHTCSGKHAGFLVLCRARGFETQGYRLSSHPLQRELLAEVAAAAQVDPDSMPVTIDGCGVPTFGLPSTAAPTSSPDCPGSRVARGLSRRWRAPDMLAGPPRPMRSSERSPGGPRRAARRASSAPVHRGLGIALKVEDGAFRAIRPALAAFLLGSESTPASSASSPWKTAAASPSERSGRGLKSRVPKR